MEIVHFLSEDENIRCGEFVENIIESTTNDMLMTSCPKCVWLIINDAKPLALKESPPEWLE